MNKLIKKSKYLVMLLVSALVFVGCTSGGDNNQDQPDPNEPVTLQWWGVFWDRDVVESLILEYEELNPNVNIEYINKWPGGDRVSAEQIYQTQLNQVLDSGNVTTIPDIFMVHNTWVGEYEPYLSPAPGQLVSTTDIQNDFYPVVANDFTSSQGVLGIPLWIDSLAVLYNINHLNSAGRTSPPSTWFEFRSFAKEITQRSGGVSRGGFAAGTPNNVSFGFEMLSLLMLQNQVRMTDVDGNPIFADSLAAEGALDFYQNFGEGGGSWTDDFESDALEFIQGDVSMIVAPSWRYHDILHFNAQYNLGLNIGVSAMPQVDGQSRRTDWATYWGNVVAADRPNSTTAWDFLNWMSQPDQLRKLRDNESLKREFFGFMYPRPSMQSELATDSFLRIFNSVLPTATSWKMVNGLEVREIFIDLIDSSGSSNEISSAQNRVEVVVNNKGLLGQ